MVFQKGDTALVVDMTVRWEYKSNSLNDTATEKVNYYKDLHLSKRNAGVLIGEDRAKG